MFTPKKKPYKKYHKGKYVSRLSKYKTINSLKNHTYYLNVLENTMISSKQLITLYQSLNKYTKKTGKVYIKIFCHQSRTKKPLEVRMGKGKGNVSFWIAKIKAGTYICEILSRFPSLAIKALSYAQYKLPFKTKICRLY
jgi:large subunit ribosomal protein L16